MCWVTSLSAYTVPGRIDSVTQPWVCLSGFMGSGKTTIGRLLGAKLGWEFIDLDEQIVAAQGRSISDIFRSEGEPVFRRLETEALETVLARTPPAVIALGGGAFIQDANRRILHSHGAVTVFLDADPMVLFERCCAEGLGRPLLQSREAFLALYEKRRPIYLMAELVVPAGSRAPEQIAGEIVTRITARAAVSD